MRSAYVAMTSGNQVIVLTLICIEHGYDHLQRRCRPGLCKEGDLD